MPNLPKVFISATSQEFQNGPRKLRIRSHIARLIDQNGCTPIVQEGFDAQADSVTVRGMLLAKLGPCSGLIHLCGFYYGAEPITTVAPRRSYTQMEYFLAKEIPSIADQVLIGIADDGEFALHCPAQTEDKAALQLAHRNFLLGRDNLYYPFRTATDLDQPIRSFLEKLAPRDSEDRIANLPLKSLGALFKGREEFIEEIRDTLLGAQERAVALVAMEKTGATPAAVHGLGGQGKTRAAIEYCLRYRKHYDALLFVSAPTPHDLRRNLGRLCGILRLNVDAAHMEKEEEQIKAALAWLETNTAWCMIIDNVDTQEAALAVNDMLTRLSKGHVIITSRVSNWQDKVVSLELGILSEDAATAFLLEATEALRNRSDQDAEAALALARNLGCLALALQHAAAYINKRRVSFTAYRHEWEKIGAKLLAEEPHLDDYKRQMLTTWKTSTERMTPAAISVLERISWLSVEPLPRNFIESLALSAGNAALARDELIQFHFLTPAHNLDADLAHGMVTKITREFLRLSEVADSRYSALQSVEVYIVKNLVPKVSYAAHQRDLWDLISPHCIGLLEKLRGTSDAENAEQLETQLGLWLFFRGQWPVANAVLEAVQERIEQKRGNAHPSLAGILSNRAHILGEMGRPEEAIPLAERGLKLAEYAYGPSHPNSAAAATILVGIRTKKGRTPGAVAEFRELLARGQAATDVRPIELAMLHNNLGEALANCGSHREAEAELREAQRILQPDRDHAPVQFASIINNLASVLQKENCLDEAAVLFGEVLQILTGTLGNEHPDVARTINNLGRLMRTMGKYPEAEAHYRHALQIKEKHFGPDGVNLLPTLVNLQVLLGLQERHDEAADIQKKISQLHR